MIFRLIISIILATYCVSEAKRYENYTLFRGIPIEDSHLEFLSNLSTVYDGNFWTMPGSLRMPVDFLIGPEYKDAFLEEANRIGVDLTTLKDDIQSAFDKQTVKSFTRKRMETFDWHNFYRVKDINNWMIDLSKIFASEMNVFSIGKSHENRDILAANVILRGSSRRSKVIIEGGIHAREWISPAVVTYLLQQIIYSAISPDGMLRKVALTYEWYFVPVLNPDGYEFTFTQDRNWRKNRNGAGVDLNRNFGYGFGIEGVSQNQNSDIYCGPNAFSEKESIAMGRFIRSKHNNLEYYISFHSYGQYIIIPYAHTSKHLDNYDEMIEMGNAAAAKIKSYYNKRYNVGTAYDTVGYKVSGASTCWTKKSFGVPYTMTIELRDRGNYGFALPTGEIIPTCQETLAGVVTMLVPRSKKFTQLKHKYKGAVFDHDQIDQAGVHIVDKTVIFVNVILSITLYVV